MGLLSHRLWTRKVLLSALLDWNLETSSGMQAHGSPVPALLGSCPGALATAQHPETLLAWCDSRAGTPIPIHHLLPDERHSLGGLGNLLGNEEEEDGLGQEDIDGDGAFLPTRCQGGEKAEVGTAQWCGHCPPLAKSAYPKAELAKCCHEALTVLHLGIHTPDITGVGERWHCWSPSTEGTKSPSSPAAALLARPHAPRGHLTSAYL